MSSILSVYASPWHRYPQYLDYVAKLQPAWIRHHQPQAGDLSDFQRVSPGSKIMLRQWDFDDSNGDRKRELYDNPKAAALKLVTHWEEKADQLEAELRQRGLPYDRSKWYFGAWNEPEPAYIPQIVEGTQELLRLAMLRNMRFGVVCSSVGNFAKPEEPAPNWNNFKPLEKPINDSGSVLIAHSYWQKEGPAGVWIDAQGNERHDAGNLAWRHHSIPLNVPILIGEAGANGFIYNRMSGEDDCGWQRMMSADQYAGQVREYIAGCDKRVIGVCIYMNDYHDDRWASFDTLPAHEQLLAIKGTVPAVANPMGGYTVHLPIIGGGTVSQEDLFPRVMNFIRQWEGGYVDHPADPGGATNRGITIGTLSRWRESKGLPAATKEDVRKLTQAEADEIYREWYWKPSGAADAKDYQTALLLMDSGVLHGVGAPQAWVREYGLDPWRIAARRLRVYTGKDGGQWGAFGKGWTNRVAALLEEMGK
ncbi:MAG: glycoside hydrolase family 108 protein [Solirubrobacterales bacterium]